MKVLLPQPEGPITAVTVFLRMSIVTPASASDLPYQTPRPWIAKTVGTAGDLGEGFFDRLLGHVDLHALQ